MKIATEPHEVLLVLLGNKICGKRFLKSIRAFLKAGYVEDWQFHQTYSICPQRGIVSRGLANVYFHELDRYVQTLAETFALGKKRSRYPVYHRVAKQKAYLRPRIKVLMEARESPNSNTLRAPHLAVYVG